MPCFAESGPVSTNSGSFTQVLGVRETVYSSPLLPNSLKEHLASFILALWLYYCIMFEEGHRSFLTTFTKFWTLLF